MTPTETALSLSLSLPQPVDVKFWVFSKRIAVDSPALAQTVVCEPREVFGISSILKSRDYFQKLLSNGFAESAQSTHFYHPFPPELEDRTDHYDYESDSDLDTDSELGDERSVEAEDQPATKEIAAGETASGLSSTNDSHSSSMDSDPMNPQTIEDAGPRCQQIMIKDAAFLTWRALIYYLYTGKITFLNLRSQDPLQRRVSTKNILCNLKNPGQTPACSPKSMYRLAEKLGLDDLRRLSLDAIRSRLLPRIILVEAFSIFTSRYQDVISTELTFLCANYHHKDIREQWPEILKKMLDTEYSHAAPVLVALLSTRLVPGVPPKADENGSNGLVPKPASVVAQPVRPLPSKRLGGVKY